MRCVSNRYLEERRILPENGGTGCLKKTQHYGELLGDGGGGSAEFLCGELAMLVTPLPRSIGSMPRREHYDVRQENDISGQIYVSSAVQRDWELLRPLDHVPLVHHPIYAGVSRRVDLWRKHHKTNTKTNAELVVYLRGLWLEGSVIAKWGGVLHT
ncbi:hypothetical protein EDD15DRAFT_2514857 [Pisolithus albus]|nr:hypothetical protein EDD15DRAFT_2514857 [Pisolithus albus]